MQKSKYDSAMYGQKDICQMWHTSNLHNHSVPYLHGNISKAIAASLPLHLKHNLSISTIL
jgi:hypothetical protein